MESTRQKKISRLLQKELAIIFQQNAPAVFGNMLFTVTKVRITEDLTIAKVYLSIFPSDNSVAQIALLQKNSTKIKYDLSVLLKKHLRKVPELAFFLDDSLDYIDSVEDSINNPDNPIK